MPEKKHNTTGDDGKEYRSLVAPISNIDIIKVMRCYPHSGFKGVITISQLKNFPELRGGEWIIINESDRGSHWVWLGRSLDSKMFLYCLLYTSDAADE